MLTGESKGAPMCWSPTFDFYMYEEVSLKGVRGNESFFSLENMDGFIHASGSDEITGFSCSVTLLKFELRFTLYIK